MRVGGSFCPCGWAHPATPSPPGVRTKARLLQAQPLPPAFVPQRGLCPGTLFKSSICHLVCWTLSFWALPVHRITSLYLLYDIVNTEVLSERCEAALERECW